MKKICIIILTLTLVLNSFSGFYATATTGETLFTNTSANEQTLPKSVTIMIDRVNEERELKGLCALTFDEKLFESAKLRSNEVAEKWSHTRPNGEKWFTVSKYVHAENLAMGHRTANSVVDDWMDSKGHRRLILGDQYTKIGAYCIKIDGTRYWVLHMGRDNPTV